MLERSQWSVAVAAVGAFALGSTLHSASAGILLGMVAGGSVGAFVLSRPGAGGAAWRSGT